MFPFPDLSERKVRQFTRAEDDITSPVIVDFYKNNKVFESIEPLLTRAVKLNSSAISYIENIKNSGEYSYFIVFVKNNDSSGTKYITSVPNYKDIDYALCLALNTFYHFASEGTLGGKGSGNVIYF